MVVDLFRDRRAGEYIRFIKEDIGYEKHCKLLLFIRKERDRGIDT